MVTHLPVFGLSLQHQRVLWLADLTGIIILHLLDVRLSLDAVVLGESALMSLLHEVMSLACAHMGEWSECVPCGRGPGSAGQQARYCDRWRG